MVKKTLRILLIALLVILPYSTILSNFSPYWTSHSFNDFLIASLIFSVIILIAGRIIFHNKTGILFFLSGIIAGPPLMLGPPEESERLMERASEEHFRYGMLIFATILFTAGSISILKKRWSYISGIQKVIVIPLMLAFILMLWDNFSSYHLSSELTTWTRAGNSAEDFFLQYDYLEAFRTTGRTLVYILTAWMSFIALRAGWISRWVCITLSVFCSIGFIFFLLFNFAGNEFYFPFMVPAIVLAPAYWLGIALISRRNKDVAY